jgi:hypothetical protein
MLASVQSAAARQRRPDVFARAARPMLPMVLCAAVAALFYGG